MSEPNNLSPEEKGNWVVIAECVVRKRIDLRNCTREQAKNDPWEHAHDEQELEQIECTVTKVIPA